MTVNSIKELRQAEKQGEPEITITDEKLAGRVRLMDIARRVAGILVFVILGLAIFAWANPLGFEFLSSPGARLARQVALAFGIILLFADYLLPGVRNYKVGPGPAGGLKLVRRKR